MSSTKTQLFRIIQKGKYLEKQGLMDGFEAYQEWRDDILEVIDGMKFEFEQLVQTPLHIETGIRWLEQTFQLDWRRFRVSGQRYDAEPYIQEENIMKRGAYAMNLKHEMKLRGSEDLYEAIKELAEEKETTVASTLRMLIAEALEKRRAAQNNGIQG
jgi:hypothetical protein